MEKEIKYIIILTIILVITTIFYTLIYNHIYLGDYIIQEQWINSSYEGNVYCDNCLWIRFSEGCNRYPVYYFENQHEIDNRFKNNDIVNINFNGKYVKGITKAYKYNYKCNYDIDLTFYYGFFIIVFMILLIFGYWIYVVIVEEKMIL